MICPTDFMFSQSSLQDYVDCSYKFYLRHILELAWPAPQTKDVQLFENHMMSGARFHRLVQQYFLGIPIEKLDAAASGDPAALMAEWWQSFKAAFKPVSSGNVFSEQILTTKISSMTLMAKFDLLVLEKGHALIYDWKTNERPLLAARMQTRLQTRVYLCVLMKEFNCLIPDMDIDPEEMQMTYWQANFPGANIVLPYSAESYQADQAYLSHLINEICATPADGFLKTNDLNQCRFCNYRSFCERDVEAGPFTEMEAEETDFNLAAFDLDIDLIKDIKI